MKTRRMTRLFSLLVLLGLMLFAGHGLANAQFQLGGDIDGEAAGDSSGSSVSLSADGSVVAIGAPNNDGAGSLAGHVRVYQDSGGSWTQLGGDIDGEAAFDRSGYSVSLSADGSVVAIGAIYNADAGARAGHVRIYQDSGGSWTQLGGDIDGEAVGDFSGSSVSLSADGSIVAIGAPYNAGAGTDAGHVRVYQYSAGSWAQLGGDIDGEAAYDESGRSVSLSADGSIVAIGAHGNDGDGAGARAGHVRVYQYSAGNWTQLGGDINGEAAGDNSGGGVSLSADGSVVAIGARGNGGAGARAGHVRVYQDSGGSWTQLGGDIDGEATGDESGRSVSLSADGSRVAIGALYNDGAGADAGHVRVYQDLGGSWTQLGGDIDGEAAGDNSGWSVSLSADGSRVAIGAPDNTGAGTDAGHVRAFISYTPAIQVVTMTVETASTTVAPGDVVTYTIELRNPSSVTVASVMLSNTLPSGLELTGSHGDDVWLQEVAPTVTPLEAVVSWGSADGDTPTNLGWTGSLGDGAVLRISYRAQVQACYGTAPVGTPDAMLPFYNQVSVLAAGGVYTDAVDIQVDCYPAVDPLNIDVSLDFVTNRFDTGGYDFDLHTTIPGIRSNRLRITAVNSDTNPAVLGLVGVFPSRDMMASPYLDSALVGHRMVAGFATDSNEVVALRLELGAGETMFTEIPYSPAVDLPSGTELVNRVGYCISHDGRTCPGTVPGGTEFPPTIQWIEPLTVTVRYRDLGDAPDSTSHTAATAMLAYPGVQANFPTVFDPATGPIPGPLHEHPRPFHLGHRVSPEVEADVGPDADLLNNILPGIDMADLDRRDDGVRAPLMPFRPCQITVLPVRVVIRPAAVAAFQSQGTRGYLNIWIDGNHDGDWQDGIPCATGGALEHVVIDHEIDVVALGAGLHTLFVPTGPVPWSAQDGQAAWVRVTLSELPSNKTLNTGGVDHGDGRGYDTPFELGETEDYLYRPTPDPLFAPNLGLDMVGIKQESPIPIAASATRAPLTSVDLKTKVTFKIDYTNQGDLVAEDVSLTQYVPAAFAGFGVIENGSISAVPAIPSDRITFDADRITWQLEDVEPGEGGTIFVSWLVDGDGSLSAASRAPLASTMYTSTAIITASNDVDLSNNTVQADVEQKPPPPTIGILQDPSVPFDLAAMVQHGTTCSNNIRLGGRGEPGDILTLVVDGTEVSTTTVAADGTWMISYLRDNQVIEGTIRFVVSTETGRTSPELVLRVDTRLLWDPISLTFTDSEGSWIHPADGIGNGSQVASGWVAQLKPSTTYSVHLRHCGDDPAPEISVSVGGIKKTLTDPDGDGIYQTTFTTPAGPASRWGASAPSAAQYDVDLSILSGQVESIFGGAIEAASGGVVYDAGDASPVAGATVAAFTVVSGSNATAPASYTGWPGADYGQTNPQTTTVSGAFDFWAPPGLYRLDVWQPGYQPYRSQDIAVVGNLLNGEIALTPVITEEVDYVIAIDGDGFDPSVLSVPPGAVIQWVNVDIQGHTATSTDPALDYPGGVGNGGWDSGVLGAGDSYLFRMSITGTLTYQDGENAANTGVIIVDPSLTGGSTIYLPLVLR